MNTNVDVALKAQGLSASDLEANRQGRVSAAQVARQAEVRRIGGRGVWLIGVSAFVGSAGFGVMKMTQTGDRMVAIVMTLIGAVIAAIPLGVYYALRFADPEKVGACKVTRLENVTVGGFLPAPNRGVYAIGLNGRRYSGFARELAKSHLGERVNAYVVEEHRIVVALEPVS